ncbi:MAG: KUP/HAK/KT family potassium transporter [Proteobacteria bacterium]|nr:KUP/HAK/KT family potassium transporter [Pseudomonadota bacterium]
MVQENQRLAPTIVGALGIVYGDIGTSPLYAFKESLAAAGGRAGSAPEILGVLSLIFWSLLVLVSLKYVVLLLRADNAGEGGILSLVALIQQKTGQAGKWSRRAVAIGVMGTALFFCDALITPAISVLSAAEGMELLGPKLHQFVMPVTIGIIIGLFAIQRRGTDKVGLMFGPIMLVWFLTIGLLGVRYIVIAPQVLMAANPLYGLALITTHPLLALTILGSVFLAVTGGEALYADMGHFGRRPVRIAWFAVVWPGLLLNYFGQGALLLTSTQPVEHPFYALMPAGALPLLIVLATAATIIASQATISGAFSVARQAVQLDLLPRLMILQTSAQARGQIYVPAVNFFMLVSVLLFVVAFGSSSALAAAYGASVVGTMLLTTVLGAAVAAVHWQWGPVRIALVFGAFLLVDLAFVADNAMKIPHGGWVPLTIAAAMYFIFITWRDGRTTLRAELARRAVKLEELPKLLEGAARVPGTAVFLVSNAGYVPTALLRNLEHNHVCHEQVVMLNLEITRTPRYVGPRAWVETLQPNVYAVRARFGFMETPDVMEALRSARQRGLKDIDRDVSFFLGWHLVRARHRPGLLTDLRFRLFAYMQRRSAQAAEFFRMPTHGVMVLATDIEL